MTTNLETSHESVTRTTEAEWKRIEAAAREDGLAELDVIERTLLVYGDHVAWTLHRFGRTDALSAVHRVGHPLQGRDYTTCGEVIPEPVRRLTLTPRFIHALSTCRYCEIEYARSAHGAAA